MTQRTGSADLPLHGGRVPDWLGERMTRLGAVICEAIVHHYGRDELLRRLAHPFWFQSFGAVMGMDWHSSGITTSVIGALKRGLKPLSGELGLHVCGGRGAHSRKTPDELVAIGERVGFDGAALAKASRLVAKVDSAAVQDGFDLYLHGFIVADDGNWVVVQQGMNGDSRQARRYHWLSEGLKSFVDAAACGDRGRRRRARSSTSPTAAPSHRAPASSTCCATLGPDGIVARDCAIAAKRRTRADRRTADCCRISSCRRITTCAQSDVVMRRLHGNLAAAADRGPADFRRAAAGARRRRAHGQGAGDGGGSGARRALPLRRSGALLARAWRQGPASVPGAAQGL